ncbi:MAG: cellulose biosynthesis protein BcsN [Beijerinckiaceae bacterium]|nr:cellulose biosynthesis protein BcsN [Beijerinckiaceae bacterium]
MRALVVSGLCLAIGGCNAPSRDPGFVAQANSAMPVQSYALGQPDAPVPSEAMLLLPPEAGRVTRVRERHFRNGTRQEIILSGGGNGENVLDVSLRTSGGDVAPRGDLQIGKPSQRGIATEAQGRLPGVSMHAVTRPMSNTFGPFGLAIGRRGNERCVLAWQWIDDLRGSANGSRSPLVSALSGGAMPASVRVRMCRTNATLDEMAAFMEGLRPVPAAINKVVSMDRRLVSSTGLADAAPMARGPVSATALSSPMAGSLEASLPGGSSASRVASAPPARRAAPVARAAAPATPRVVRTEGQPAPVRYQLERGPQPVGPRYLAPVEGGAGSAPAAVGQPPVHSAQRLDSSLPSRAYLGPSGQR